MTEPLTYAERMSLAAQKVQEAWIIEGPVPEYHRRMQERLAREWPVLHRRLVELAQVRPD